MPPIDAVIFDLDDTLLTTRDSFMHAMAVVQRTYGLVGDGEAIGRMWRDDPSGYFHRYTQGELTLREQRLLRVNEIHAAFGGPPIDEVAYVEWEEIFEAAALDGCGLHDDVPDALEFVAAQGWKTGVISNAVRSLQLAKMARVGLRLPFLVGMEEFGAGKPDPRVFQDGCRQLGVLPERTVYVGDEFDIDALGAQSAGLQAIWLDRPGHRRAVISDEDIAAAGFPVITTLADLPRVLG